MRTGLLVAVLLSAAVAAVGCRPGSSPELAADASVAADASATDVARAPVTIDPRRRQLVGVRTARVERGPVAATVRAAGVVAIPETTQVEINTKVDGWIRGLKANATGLAIRQGDPLFVLYSPALLALENEFIAALHGRQQAAKSSLTEAREHAEQIIEIVRGRLLLLDVSVNEVRELERRGRGLGEMTFLSPASGVIVQKDVVEGMFVTAGQRLFRLADLSTVWVEAELHERDLGGVATGRPAVVTLDAYPGERFNGRVTQIGTEVSRETRTLKVRLELGNAQRRLKPGMYGAVTIESARRDALTVPADAVVDSGAEQVVFLAEGDGYFEPRRVRAGRRYGDRVEILEGLDAGQMVASGATFFIDSESQFGAALQHYAAPAEASAGGARSAAPGETLDVALTVRPDPPRAGTLALDVTVTQAGRPLDAADVQVVLSMPAMPSMGMGAMRTAARLSPAGNGRYTGDAEVAHAGRWDVTVSVSRAGQPIGTRQLALVVR